MKFISVFDDFKEKNKKTAGASAMTKNSQIDIVGN